MNKKVYIFLFNGFSDWEIAYLTPEIKKSKGFDLVFFSKEEGNVCSMGGMQVVPDMSLDQVKADDVDLLILPGGTAWETDENSEVDQLVMELFSKGKTIAAICGATVYLGRRGLLDNLKHTSNDLGYLKWIVPQYAGEANYINQLAVTDRNLITASGVAPIEFAREIFTKLTLRSDEDIEKWFQLFKNGIWKE